MIFMKNRKLEYAAIEAEKVIPAAARTTPAIVGNCGKLQVLKPQLQLAA